MAFIPVATTVQVGMCYIWDGQKVQNTYHFEYPSFPTVPEMTALAVAMVAWWTTEMRAIAPAYFSLCKVIVTDLSYQTAPSIEYAEGLPLAGSGVGDSMPNNVTVAVKWTTGLRGRSYRGRTYHMPILLSQVQGNMIPTGDQQGLAAAYGALLTLDTTVGLPDLVIVSRYSGTFPRAQGVTTPVTGVTVDGILDSQRRRLPGRGD